jgi:putative ABC transport system permease protein
MRIMALAQARENFLAAMETLRSSKVRSALTVLGIVIGVSSVISMAAIMQGLNKFVQDKVESLGSRTYFLTRFPPGMDPAHMPERIRTRKYLEYNYADFIRQAAPDVQIVTTVGTRGFFFGDSNLITSGDHSVEKVIVRGAEPEYTQAIPLFAIARGRFISTCFPTPTPLARQCASTVGRTRSSACSSTTKDCSSAREWTSSPSSR